MLQARLLALGVRRHARRGDVELLGEVLDNPAWNVHRIGDERKADFADAALAGSLHAAGV